MEPHKYCDCKSWKDCRFSKTGIGFSICQGTAIMPDGSVISSERRQQYIDKWTAIPKRTSVANVSTSARFIPTCPYRGEELRRELCPSCRGHVEVKVFACDKNGECTATGKTSGCQSCTWKADQTNTLENLPVYVMMSPREGTLHAKTLASIFAAGFDDVTVSSEPKTDIASLRKLFPSAKFIQRTEKLGQWRHLIEIFKTALTSQRSHVILAEDDVEFCRHTSTHLIKTKWPSVDCGCVQLYAAEPYRRYPYGKVSRLAPEHALDLLGACAMLLRLDAVRVLLDWTTSNVWRGDTGRTIDDPTMKKAGDTFVGEILTTKGFSIWTHNPSIVRHAGTGHSTLGHDMVESANRKTLAFPGVDADLLSIFK